MKPEPIERVISFALAVLIPVAAGMALTMVPPPGDTRQAAALSADRGVLLVELIPAHRTNAAAPTTADAPPAQLRENARDAQRSASRLAATAAPADAGVGGTPQLAVVAQTRSGQAQGSAQSELSGAVAINYRNILLTHIARYRRTLSNGIEGTVEIRFILDRNGGVLNAWVATSSGEAVLDAEALAAIRRAAPMPDIPAALPDRVDITLPMDFEIG